MSLKKDYKRRKLDLKTGDGCDQIWMAIAAYICGVRRGKIGSKRAKRKRRSRLSTVREIT
jgi:hypothetical protein